MHREVKCLNSLNLIEVLNDNEQKGNAIVQKPLMIHRAKWQACGALKCPLFV